MATQQREADEAGAEVERERAILRAFDREARERGSILTGGDLRKLADTSVVWTTPDGEIGGVDTAVASLQSRYPNFFTGRRLGGGTPPRPATRSGFAVPGAASDLEVRRLLIASGRYSRM